MSKRKDIKSLPLANSVLLSKNFREEYLSYEDFDVLLDQSTITTKLIFYIISDLRNNVFFTSHYMGKENQTKLDLWNQEFCSGEGIEIYLRYNIKSFLKNRDKRAMKKSLKFIKDFKNEEYSFLNSKGEKITTSGGLIKDWYFGEKSGNFEISISQYWANKIVALEVYNEFIMSLLNTLSNNKQVFFVTWLLELKGGVGQALYMTLQERYRVNYPSRYEFCRSFLLPIKTKLDKQDKGISFNYTADDKNKNKINFVVYPLKPISEIDVKTSKFKNLDAKNINDYKKVNSKMIAYKAIYYKRRHNLSLEDVKFIKELMQKDYYKFDDNYKSFVKKCRENKVKASDINGLEFIKKINIE